MMTCNSILECVGFQWIHVWRQGKSYTRMLAHILTDLFTRLHVHFKCMFLCILAYLKFITKIKEIWEISKHKLYDIPAHERTFYFFMFFFFVMLLLLLFLSSVLLLLCLSQHWVHFLYLNLPVSEYPVEKKLRKHARVSIRAVGWTAITCTGTNICPAVQYVYRTHATK